MTTSALIMKDFSTLAFNQSTESFDSGWQKPLSVLLGLGRAAGADFVEIFLEKRNFIQCLIETGNVSAISPSLSRGAGVRISRGSDDCYVSTTDLTFKGLGDALKRGLSILGLQLPSAHFFVPELNLEPLRDYGTLKNKNKWLAECPNTKQMTDYLMSANASLRKKVGHVQSAMSSAFRDHQEVLVASTEGIFARDVRLIQRMNAQVVCVDGVHRAALGDGPGASGNPHFLLNFDANRSAEELAESSGQMLRADYVQAGNYPVILANHFGGVIFHEACGHLLETTQIERKTTPFMDMKGELIAHEGLSAWDEGLTPEAFGSIDMDDEGMPAQRTLLIENGILRNFIADRAGAIKAKMPRTGSGRRQNYHFSAASRMRNTYIAPGKYKKEELFSSLDKGLYCKKLGGGSVGPTGEFNFAVQEAYLIENGRIVKPVKGATLIGEAKEVMKNISMCADDIGLASGFCGSISGSIYVTVGQPHIKVDSITVGGR